MSQSDEPCMRQLSPTSSDQTILYLYEENSGDSNTKVAIMLNTGKRAAVDELESSSRKKIYPVGPSRPIKKEESVTPEPSLPKVTFHHRSHSTPVISIPSGVDDFLTILSRLTSITIELATGRSVAIATGFLDNARLSHLDPRGSAISLMPLDEKEMWDVFQASPEEVRQNIPSIDWTTCKLETESDDSVKRNNRRAAALNELYGTDIINHENAKWFNMNHMHLLPIVKAIDRMQAADRITTLSPEATYRRLVKVEIDCLLQIAAVSQALFMRKIKWFQEHGVASSGIFPFLGRGGDTTAQARLLWRVVEKETVGDMMRRKLLYAAELDSFMRIIKPRKAEVTELGKEALDTLESVVSCLSEIYNWIDQLVTE